MRKLIGEQLTALRVAKGMTQQQAATRSRLRLEQVQKVEAGGAKFSTASALAALYGKYVVVRGFYKRKNATAADIGRQTLLDTATAAACIRKAHTPVNEPDCDVLSLELVLMAWSETATLTLSDVR